MKLIIGGYAQGKLEYVRRRYHLEETAVLDGALPAAAGENGRTVIIDHFHLWVRHCMEKGECPEETVQEYLKSSSDCIIISDEIGNGIVPVDAFEREYRERLGRILIGIAQKAEEVVRITCGLGQKIK